MITPALLNDRWFFIEQTGTYVTELSDHDSGLLDPWNQQMPKLVPEYDAWGEDIEGWRGTTAINGIAINLLIIND